MDEVSEMSTSVEHELLVQLNRSKILNEETIDKFN